MKLAAGQLNSPVNVYLTALNKNSAIYLRNPLSYQIIV